MRRRADLGSLKTVTFGDASAVRAVPAASAVSVVLIPVFWAASPDRG